MGQGKFAARKLKRDSNRFRWSDVNYARRRLGLENEAHLLDRGQEGPRVHRRAVPAQHVAIEEVPFLARLDARADLGAGDDQPLGGEHLDGLAHRGAADVVGLAPRRLVREQRARSVFALQDARADVLRHRLVLTPEAELERATPLGSIRAALEDVPVPR